MMSRDGHLHIITHHCHQWMPMLLLKTNTHHTPSQKIMDMSIALHNHHYTFRAGPWSLLLRHKAQLVPCSWIRFQVLCRTAPRNTIQTKCYSHHSCWMHIDQITNIDVVGIRMRRICQSLGRIWFCQSIGTWQMALITTMTMTMTVYTILKDNAAVMWVQC